MRPQGYYNTWFTRLSAIVSHGITAMGGKLRSPSGLVHGPGHRRKFQDTQEDDFFMDIVPNRSTSPAGEAHPGCATFPDIDSNVVMQDAARQGK